jgi:hypothetical protein
MFGDLVCLGTPHTHACALHHVSLPDIKAAAIQRVSQRWWSFKASGTWMVIDTSEEPAASICRVVQEAASLP